MESFTGGINEQSDSALLLLLKKGDDAAFSVLYKRYWKKVLAVAVYKLSNIEEAESVVQDIFYTLWKRRKDLEINIGLNHYLMASVKYQVIKSLDKRRRERLFREEEYAVDILDDSTQQYLEVTELTKRLEQLVNQLPEKPKLIYKMNKEDGKSYREIADALNMTEKSVDAYLFRVKKELRRKLGSFIYLLLF